jgi:hypothetical protein
MCANPLPVKIRFHNANMSLIAGIVSWHPAVIPASRSTNYKLSKPQLQLYDLIFFLVCSIFSLEIGEVQNYQAL